MAGKQIAWVMLDGSDGFWCSHFCATLDNPDYQIPPVRPVRWPSPGRSSQLQRLALSRMTCDRCGFNFENKKGK